MKSCANYNARKRYCAQNILRAKFLSRIQEFTQMAPGVNALHARRWHFATMKLRANGPNSLESTADLLWTWCMPFREMLKGWNQFLPNRFWPFSLLTCIGRHLVMPLCVIWASNIPITRKTADATQVDSTTLEVHISGWVFDVTKVLNVSGEIKLRAAPLSTSKGTDFPLMDTCTIMGCITTSSEEALFAKIWYVQVFRIFWWWVEVIFVSSWRWGADGRWGLVLDLQTMRLWS